MGLGDHLYCFVSGYFADHIVMNLSVKIGGMDFDYTKFTFFDCSLHTDTA